jgi:hypothetical protein
VYSLQKIKKQFLFGQQVLPEALPMRPVHAALTYGKPAQQTLEPNRAFLRRISLCRQEQTQKKRSDLENFVVIIKH